MSNGPDTRPGSSQVPIGPSEEVFHGHHHDAIAFGLPIFTFLRLLTLGGGLLTTATIENEVRTIPPVLERAAICARTLRDHKARDITVLDLRKIHPLYDFFIIGTGTSRRQIHTLAEEIDDSMKAVGDSRQGIEGYQASKWIVQDYGDILVHVFDPDTRTYYNLEELWADAPRIDWERE